VNKVAMTTFVRFAPAFVLCLMSMASAPAFAQATNTKPSPERVIDIKKVFPFYDIYLGLPSGDRDGFKMTYRVGSRTSALRPQLFYQIGTTRTPIVISPTGVITTMPDTNMLRNGQVYKPAGQPSGSINLDLEPVIPLSRTISAADAVNPLNDYDAAKRRAGPLALIAPRISSIRFVGVSSGEAIMRDNRRVALPSAPTGGVLFTPSASAMRGVVSLSFSGMPTDAEFAQ
jgi:hypothetical protein